MINEKGLYGMMSGVATTLLLQPFQNIKMALMIPPRQLKSQYIQSSVFQNIKTSCKYIYSNDGTRGFYKGMVAATLKAALGCYIYFAGLRKFQQPNMSAGQNFLVSSVSRLISTFLTNPLSVIQTRFQIAYFHGYSSIWSAVKDIYRREGSKAFFSGGLSSCLKQATFGGFHYMFYEQLKAYGINKFLSGVTSGMMATAITHPFQIIRAKLQTIGLYQKHEFSDHLIIAQLKKLKNKGGWTNGLAPRLIKKPIANTLTFLMFEILEDSQSNR